MPRNYVIIFLLASLVNIIVAETAETYRGKIFVNGYRPQEDDEYVCTALKLHDDFSYYVTGFNPHDSNGSAHHLLIYGCERPAQFTNGVYSCSMTIENGDFMLGEHCDNDYRETLLFQAAMGSGHFQLPDDVAFKVGKGTPYKYIVLQVHYAHVEPFENDPNLKDYSGFEVAYQITPTKLLGGILISGAPGYVMPNAMTKLGEDKVDYICPDYEMPRSHTLVMFAFHVHAHNYGTFMSAFRVRNYTYDKIPKMSKGDQDSKEKQWSLIGGISPQKEQNFYYTHNELSLRPTDILAVRCVYSNPTDDVIFFGEGANDEMCVYYVMYYTIPMGEGGDEVEYIPACQPVEVKDAWEDNADLLGPVPDWVQKYSLQL
ncbi:peptidylglycine alpha-hydroxylating monooxygenase-like [Convolutriloba macropyga]|uniref:peptidylglycine alpha-hydroxylating monooxygenase-like n=1 Tax=Convolutriloba macropyga TaxID=536237 RepID=UPI003F5250D5